MDRVAVPTAVHPVSAARLDWGAIDLYLSGRYLAHLAAGLAPGPAFAQAKIDLSVALGGRP